MDDKRFEQLLADHFDQPLSAVERAELESRLLENEDARQAFVQAAMTQVEMTAALGVDLPAVPTPPAAHHPPRLLLLAAVSWLLSRWTRMGP